MAAAPSPAGRRSITLENFTWYPMTFGWAGVGDDMPASVSSSFFNDAAIVSPDRHRELAAEFGADRYTPLPYALEPSKTAKCTLVIHASSPSQALYLTVQLYNSKEKNISTKVFALQLPPAPKDIACKVSNPTRLLTGDEINEFSLSTSDGVLWNTPATEVGSQGHNPGVFLFGARPASVEPAIERLLTAFAPQVEIALLSEGDGSASSDLQVMRQLLRSEVARIAPRGSVATVDVSLDGSAETVQCHGAIVACSIGDAQRILPLAVKRLRFGTPLMVVLNNAAGAEGNTRPVAAASPLEQYEKCLRMLPELQADMEAIRPIVVAGTTLSRDDETVLTRLSVKFDKLFSRIDSLLADIFPVPSREPSEDGTGADAASGAVNMTLSSDVWLSVGFAATQTVAESAAAKASGSSSFGNASPAYRSLINRCPLVEPFVQHSIAHDVRSDQRFHTFLHAATAASLGVSDEVTAALVGPAKAQGQKK